MPEIVDAPEDARKNFGEVGEAVIAAIKSFRGDFTSTEVDKVIQNTTGITYERSSIRSALSRLSEEADPIFAVKVQGKGRRPTIYKRLTLL